MKDKHGKIVGEMKLTKGRLKSLKYPGPDHPIFSDPITIGYGPTTKPSTDDLPEEDEPESQVPEDQVPGDQAGN